MKIFLNIFFFISTSSLSAQTLYEKQIIPFDAMNLDRFGANIAINDTLLFISSLRYSNSVDACVYVYKYTDSDYIYDCKIYPNDPEPNVLFGSNMLYKDDQLFVGAREKKVNGYGTGVLYIFKNENNNWIQNQKIEPPEPLISQKYFSEAIDKFNETLVVGSYRSDAGANDDGKVFIYKYINNQYVLQQELSAYDPKDYQFFGNSLVLKDKLLLVGSCLDSTDSGFESGSIYAYLKKDSVWTFAKKFIPQSNPQHLTLGTSLTSNDDYVFAGSAASFSYNLPGKVYVYKLTDPLIEFDQIIESGEGYWNDRFGINMLAKGDTLLVTAFYDSVNNSYPGSVYMFVKENDYWTKKRKIVPSDEKLANLFGASLALNDEIFFIGAPTSDISQEISCGKVYLFSSNPLSVFDDSPPLVSIGFQVSQNFPNPFNSNTRIEYYLPSNGDIVIEIINNLGQRIISRQILNQSEGHHYLDINLNGYSSGVYFIKVNCTYEVQNKVINSAFIKKAVYIK